MWFSIPCVGGFLWGQSYIRKHLQDHKIKYTFNTFSSSKSQEISEVLENSWLYSFSLEKGRAGFWKLCLSVLTQPQAPSVLYSTFFPFQMFSSHSAVFLIWVQDLWDLQAKAMHPLLSTEHLSIPMWEHGWILPCPSSQLFPREDGIHHPKTRIHLEPIHGPRMLEMLPRCHLKFGPCAKKNLSWPLLSVLEQKNN